MKKTVITIGIAAIAAIFFIVARFIAGSDADTPESTRILPTASPTPSSSPIELPVVSETATPKSQPAHILLDVPFTPQAPLANWADPRQQDGCEEASLIMANAWVHGETFTLQEAEQKIIAFSDWELRERGDFRDTSAEDTAQLMRDYLGYQNVRAEKGIATTDIVREVQDGNLVIVPVNGQRLGNPFYTPPGPSTHMLVIRGYDPATKEFISNDPGTRRGEQMRYREDILAGALQDYPTGYHGEQIPGDTAMIVVWR